MSPNTDNKNIANIGDYADEQYSGQLNIAGSENGGDNGDNGNLVDNEYIDVKVEAAKSELVATAAELRADFASFRTTITEQISHIPNTFTFVVLLLGFLALVFAAMQISGTQFSSGYAASSAYARQIEEYRSDTNARFDDTNSRIDETNVRLGSIENLLVEAIERQPQGRQPDGHQPEGN